MKLQRLKFHEISASHAGPGRNREIDLFTNKATSAMTPLAPFGMDVRGGTRVAYTGSVNARELRHAAHARGGPGRSLENLQREKYRGELTNWVRCSPITTILARGGLLPRDICRSRHERSDVLTGDRSW